MDPLLFGFKEFAERLDGICSSANSIIDEAWLLKLIEVGVLEN